MNTLLFVVADVICGNSAFVVIVSRGGGVANMFVIVSSFVRAVCNNYVFIYVWLTLSVAMGYRVITNHQRLCAVFNLLQNNLRRQHRNSDQPTFDADE